MDDTTGDASVPTPLGTTRAPTGCVTRRATQASPLHSAPLPPLRDGRHDGRRKRPHGMDDTTGDASVPTPLRTTPAPTGWATRRAPQASPLHPAPLPPLRDGRHDGRRKRPHSTPHHSRPYGRIILEAYRTPR